MQYRLLTCNDPEASYLSATALKVLFRHASHGCFNQTATALLCAGANELRQAIKKELDPVSASRNAQSTGSVRVHLHRR